MLLLRATLCFGDRSRYHSFSHLKVILFRIIIHETKQEHISSCVSANLCDVSPPLKHFEYFILQCFTYNIIDYLHYIIQIQEFRA